LKILFFLLLTPEAAVADNPRATLAFQINVHSLIIAFNASNTSLSKVQVRVPIFFTHFIKYKFDSGANVLVD